MAKPLNARQFGIWLIVAGGLAVFYALVYGANLTAAAWDWQNMWRNGALGDTSLLTSPYWSLFLSYLPSRFADPLGYLIWIGVGAILVLLVANQFASSLLLVLTSYQLNAVLFYGQIEPYVLAGIGLGSLALKRSNPWLLGIALALVTLKPQVGGLVAVYFFLQSPARLKTVLTFAVIVLASLLVWPWWPLPWLSEHILPFLDRYVLDVVGFGTSPGIPMWLGLPVSLLALWLPLEPKQKIQALVATNLLVFPYVPFYTHLPLLCLGLPIPFYLYGLVSWVVVITLGPFGNWQWAFVFPLGVLIYCYAGALPRQAVLRVLRRITGKAPDGTGEIPRPE